LSTCSLRKTLRDTLLSFKLLRYGASKSISAEEFLGHLVKSRKSVLILQIAAGIMWNVSYKRRWAFSEYFNSLLKQHIELFCLKTEVL